MQIHKILAERDKEFILSFKAGQPRWELFAFPRATLARYSLEIAESGENGDAKTKEELKKLEAILTKGSTL